jgi:hypothetical protein
MNERDFYLIASFGAFFVALAIELILLRLRVNRANGAKKDEQ